MHFQLFQCGVFTVFHIFIARGFLFPSRSSSSRKQQNNVKIGRKKKMKTPLHFVEILGLKADDFRNFFLRPQKLRRI